MVRVIMKSVCARGRSIEPAGMPLESRVRSSEVIDLALTERLTKQLEDAFVGDL
jgi:hypothetical protein